MCTAEIRWLIRLAPVIFFHCSCYFVSLSPVLGAVASEVRTEASDRLAERLIPLFFKDVLTGFLPRRKRLAFLPLIAADETLAAPGTRTLLASKPQSRPACQTRAALRSNTDEAGSSFYPNSLKCVFVVVSLQLSGPRWWSGRRWTSATTSMETPSNRSSSASSRLRSVGKKRLSSRCFQHGSECSFLSLQMFKGPDQDIEAIYTAPSSAVCGASLQANGKEYLITGGSSPHARSSPPRPLSLPTLGPHPLVSCLSPPLNLLVPLQANWRPTARCTSPCVTSSSPGSPPAPPRRRAWLSATKWAANAR